MFQQSFHFNCIHFRGSSMVFPYLHMICNQVLLDYRLCLLIYIIPMASVTRELNSCRREQTAGQVCNINYLVWYRNGLLVPVLRDGCRRDWERWLLKLNLPVEKWHRTKQAARTGAVRAPMGKVCGGDHGSYRRWRQDFCSESAWKMAASLPVLEKAEETPGALRSSPVTSAERSRRRYWDTGCMQWAHMGPTLHTVPPSICITLKVTNRILSPFSWLRAGLLTRPVVNNEPDVQVGPWRDRYLFVSLHDYWCLLYFGFAAAAT